jgi:hypothetical protein
VHSIDVIAMYMQRALLGHWARGQRATSGKGKYLYLLRVIQTLNCFMFCFKRLADVVLAKQNKCFYEISKKQYNDLKVEPMISCDNM